MHRPLGIFERALFLSDQRSPFNVLSALQLENAPAPEIVQKGLRVLQDRHPLLRAGIKNGEFVNLSNPAFTFTIIESQGNQHWLDIVEHEMNARLDPAGALFRGVYVYSSKLAELILTFHHAIIDAASGMNLLDELLHICAEDGTSPLSPLEVVPPVEQRFPPSFKGLRGSGKLMRYAVAQMADEVEYQWRVRRKRKPVIHLGGPGFPLSLTLPAGLVDALSRNCRARNITLNSLLSASLLLAVNRLLYAGDSRLMHTFSFADLRPYTAPPTPAVNLANYISMLRYTIQVSGRSDIWILAKDLHDKIYRSLKRGDKFTASRASESLIRMIVGMKSMRMGATALNYSGAVPLKSQYGNIKVRGLHGFLSSFDLGPEVSAQALLFNDELWLDFMFLETDMDKEVAGKIVGEVKSILESSFGLRL